MYFKRPLTGLAVSTLVLAAVTACTPAEPEPSHSADSDESQSSGEPIRFALDWSLNTNHIGLVVADAEGYFAEAGIDVEILPLGSTTQSEEIWGGAADVGISEQTGIQISRTQGLEVTSVFQVVQREKGVVSFHPDRGEITRPADLDGQTFGGFGDPIWTAVARAVVTGDGGTGEFDDAVLDADVYDSLESGAVGFTLSVVSWENAVGEMQGRPYGTCQ